MNLKHATLLALALSLPLAAFAEPQWIWSSKNAGDKDKATFKHTFELLDDIKSATLNVSCDNGAKVFINGKLAAENPDWMQPTKAEVKAQLQVGSNEIKADATNKGGSAAFILQLVIETTNGKKIEVETSDKWQYATGNGEWKAPLIIAKYGAAPYGDVFSKKGKFTKAAAPKNEPGTATAPADIIALPGFKVELLYTVPKAEQGSWVSMTVDKKGRILAGDQYGALYRLTPPPIGSTEKSTIEPLNAQISGAHGLLYAFDSLYVMVNEKGGQQGLWRLKDTDGEGTFGTPEQLYKMAGGGEHGPHSVIVGPDGKSLLFNGGNHTKLPDGLEVSRAAKAWGEDHILPRMWDANGHARGIMAPGGYICKTDPDGKNLELFCYGFRNEFDIALDGNGELFTFDADMEWDIGSPWYRPTRINHCVSGGDYGWRSGSGKWPTYYADSLPACVDIGPGSPTGVASGKGAKFPAKYQRAIFANDWTYGTMYAIHNVGEGGTVKSVKEEFISGKPLPLTDLVINPKDGAMYFGIGGRRTQSGLYRVTYSGAESTETAKPEVVTEEATMRHELEKLHLAGTGPEAIDKAWPYLAHSDRFVRFAARVAIERQPTKLWAEKALNEKKPQALIEAMIALARVGGSGEAIAPPPETKPAKGASSSAVGKGSAADAALQGKILAALGSLDFAKQDVGHQLQIARAYQLAFIRLGKPSPEVCASTAEKLDAFFPGKEYAVNRELSQLLIFLDSPRAVSKTLGLMATAMDDSQAIATDELLARNTGYARAADEAHTSRPNRQQIDYMFALRNATAGWTPELRRTYFSWFPHARTWKGGNSFKGFIENTRKEALVTFAPESERADLDALSSKNEVIIGAVAFVAPKGPGKNYTIDDVLALAKDGLKGRSFEQGRSMFTATMCSACHHFGGDGGNIGPDVTGAGNRYTLHDLMENIIEPSKVISDQYDSQQIEKKDGSLIIGRIVSSDAGKLMVMTNPFAPTELMAVNESDVKSKKTYPVSMMPPGLINTLNKDELLDLVAYLLSGGNPKDKAFAQ